MDKADSPGVQDNTTAQARENEMNRKEMKERMEALKNLRKGFTKEIPEKEKREDNN